MTRQNISTGTTANDGTGDTLRSAGTKINQNFVELYQAFGTDSSTLGSGITFDTSGIVIEGTTNTTTIAPKDPGSDVTFQIPDSSGEAVILSPDNIVYLKDSTGATSKIYYGNVFSTEGDLPSATTYHGMFAHVHATGKGYFSHNNAWHALVDSDTFTSRTGLQLINPKMDTTIFDNTGTFGLLELDNTSTGNTSYVKITNVDDSAPVITAEGTSTDVGVRIKGKNNGVLTLDGKLGYGYQSVTGSTDSDLDSSANFYMLNVATPKSFKMHDGSVIGETKRFANRRSSSVTINFNSNKFEHPTGPYTSFTMTDIGLITIVWTGSEWVSDKDSDKYITFA